MDGLWSLMSDKSFHYRLRDNGQEYELVRSSECLCPTLTVQRGEHLRECPKYK